MTPRPGLRRAAKWASTLVFAAAAAGIVLSTSRFARCWWEHGSRTSIEIVGGQLELWNVPVRPVGPGIGPELPRTLPLRLHRVGWSITHNHPTMSTHWHWWFEFTGDRSGFMVSLPLWMPAAAAGFASLRFWRTDVRAAIGRRWRSRGLCSRCRYDRTGLGPESVCPECGAPPSVVIAR